MSWMILEPIAQSEGSQKEKNKYRVLPHICGIQKDGTDEPIWSGDADVDDRLVGAVREGEGGTDRESSMETYTRPCVKQMAGGNLLYDAGSSNPVLCDFLER